MRQVLEQFAPEWLQAVQAVVAVVRFFEACQLATQVCTSSFTLFRQNVAAAAVWEAVMKMCFPPRQGCQRVSSAILTAAALCKFDLCSAHSYSCSAEPFFLPAVSLEHRAKKDLRPGSRSQWKLGYWEPQTSSVQSLHMLPVSSLPTGADSPNLSSPPCPSLSLSRHS